MSAGVLHIKFSPCPGTKLIFEAGQWNTVAKCLLDIDHGIPVPQVRNGNRGKLKMKMAIMECFRCWMSLNLIEEEFKIYYTKIKQHKYFIA